VSAFVINQIAHLDDFVAVLQNTTSRINRLLATIEPLALSVEGLERKDLFSDHSGLTYASCACGAEVKQSLPLSLFQSRRTISVASMVLSVRCYRISHPTAGPAISLNPPGFLSQLITPRAAYEMLIEVGGEGASLSFRRPDAEPAGIVKAKPAQNWIFQLSSEHMALLDELERGLAATATGVGKLWNFLLLVGRIYSFVRRLLG
jgi:hypothetical protein